MAWSENFDGSMRSEIPVSIVPQGDKEYLMLKRGPEMVEKRASQPNNF